MSDFALGVDAALKVAALANHEPKGPVQTLDSRGSAPVKELRRKVEQKIKRRQRTEAEMAEAIAELRRVCTHEHVVEAPYEPSRSGMFDSLKPLRLCTDCGIEEEGWGVGFNVLDGSAQEVARNKLYSLRLPGSLVRVKRDPDCGQVFDVNDLDDWHRCAECRGKRSA